MASKKGKPDKAAKPTGKKPPAKKAKAAAEEVEELDVDSDVPEDEVEDDAEIDPEIDPEDLDDDLEADELLEGEDDAFVEEDEFDDDSEEEAVPVARRTADDEDDDDLTTPDDVEADLDTILKDRLVAADDVPEEDDEENEVEDRSPDGDALQPRRADEEMCSSCFLLVRRSAPNCPVGDDGCPIFAK